MRFILLGIACSLGSAGANPDWTNVVEAPTTPGGSSAIAIQNASGGQFYVAGTTAGSDFLLIRADSSGKERWRVTYNGTNHGADTLRALAVDTAGNAYGVGRSEGVGAIAEIAVLKCTAKGVQKWVARFRDAENRPLDPTAAAVDPAGNLYVVATRPAEEGLLDQLLLRFSTRGQLQWLQTNAQQLARSDARVALITDGTKAAYLVGMSGGLVTLSKYLSTGALEWQSAHPGELPTNTLAAAAVDSAGNLHVVSSYRVAATQQEDARVDMQIEKLNRKGAVLWRVWHRGVIPSTLLPSGLALQKSGNITVFGLERRFAGAENNLIVVLWDRLGRKQWSAWQDMGIRSEVNLTATAQAQGGIGVFIDNPGRDEVIALALDADGNRRWQETNQLSVRLRGSIALATDVLVALAELPDGFEKPNGIMLLGYQRTNGKTPKLIRVPNARTVAEDAPTTFEVTARGRGPVGYRWWHDNELLTGLIPDADKPSLRVEGVNPTLLGEYAVEVIDGDSAVLSRSARLDLSRAPRFVAMPSLRDAEPGATSWISAGVDGSEPIHLQWQHNGFDIPGAHDPFLVIPATTAGDAGSYRLLASNSVDVVVSESTTLSLVGSGGLDTWSWLEPSPQGNTISGIAFGAGRFVAATIGGTLMWARFGSAWQVLPPFRDEIFNAITWADGRFVVGGYNRGNAVLRTSTNGLTWTLRLLPSSNALIRVTAGGGIILTVDSRGTFFRSTNGTDWLAFNPGLNPSALGYGNGLFVAAGSLPLVHTSPDGLTWTPHTLPSSVEATDVTVGNGRFIVVGRSSLIATSTDGNNWTTMPYGANATMTAVVYGQNEFVAVSLYGDSYSSSDGLSWFSQAIGPSGIYGVAYGNGVFTCGGTRGAVYTSPKPGFWTPHTIGGGDKKYRKVHSVNNVTVIVGDDATVLRSSGGGDFIPCAVTAFENYRGVTFGAGLWVAVGDDGTIETSPDTMVWSTIESPVNTDLRSVAFGNGRFVAVGDGGSLLASRDGSDWRALSTTSNALRAVHFADGTFVAVGELGTLLVSDNGERWRSQTLGNRKELTSACFGNGLWLVASENGDVWSSSNTTGWNAIDTGEKNLTGLAYDNGLFVMIAKGMVLSSSDGREWERHHHGIFAELRDLAFENGRVIAVGSDQTIALSNPLQSP